MARKSKSPPKPVPSPAESLTMDTVPAPVFAAGKARGYLSTAVPKLVTKTRCNGQMDYVLIAVLVLVGAYVRMRNLGAPNSVVFDEVHFGGFSKKYVLGTFFMDVHPPLAKMLFATVSSLGGYNGAFDFAKIGDVYPENVPYVLMRAFAAVLGLVTVVLSYSTLRASGVRPVVAFATAFLLLIENSFVTISRYILLDAPLVFFIASAVYAFKKFEVQQPFSFAWYRCLVSCGVSLGLAFSSKWVGLFTIAWVGILCVVHMWLLIGDLSVKPATIMKSAVARASVLLGIPAVIYLVMFSAHFSVLTNDSDGAAFMSSAFRSGLAGSRVPKTTDAQVGYGSTINLRHVETRGGYLHSHAHFYPTGSKQQQITLYPHLDANNDWVIEPYNFTTPEEFVPIQDGTKIRLVHTKSQRRLHSHDEKAPVSDRDWQKEVSCYGYEGFGGDANDDWIVEVVKHRTPKHAQENITAIETVFRLRHAMSGRYLFASETKLPDWGFSQTEVTSAGQGARPLTHWYIETNRNLKLENPKQVSYPKLGFWSKLIELHKVMVKVNNGLTSHHNWQSQPHEWPLLLRGINYWNKDHTQVYFVGNPVIWWTASACVLGFVIHVFISILKWQVGSDVATNKYVFNYNYQMFTYFVGWAVHYLPFFVMGRQLFLHHYLPAQYFAILGLGHFFDLLVTSSQKYRKPAYGFLALFVVVALYFHSVLSPLIGASQWSKEKCLKSKLVSTWDFDCNTFLQDSSEYADYYSSKTETTPSAVETQDLVNEVIEEVREQAEDVTLGHPLEAPPPAETHAGKFPFDDDVVVPEEIPVGELQDEATPQKEQEPVPEVETVESEKSSIDEGAPKEPELEIQEILHAGEAAETLKQASGIDAEEKFEDAKENFDAAASAAGKAKDAAASAAGIAKDAAVSAAENAKEAAVSAAENAKDAAISAAGKAQEIAEPVAQQAQDAVHAAAGRAQGIVEPIIERAQEAAVSAAEKAEAVAKPIAQAHEAASGKARDIVEPIMEKAQEAAERAKAAN